ncbi:MAG TPA: arginine--tRNA ligase, partial [Candidatus Eisenbacteria bacterium]|nr:arginine--tRNA ligase [Candidatus Eisenbacteria bacterium]
APGRDAEYQSNAAMSLARRLGRPSREIGEAVVGRLETGDMLEPARADGPGFVNLTLRREWLERQVSGLSRDERAGVPLAESPRRVVIDYSSPNMAKELHVGNQRSTFIGDSLHRLLRFRGDEMIPQNHLGDWGTPFGMLLEHLVDEDGASGNRHSISDLNAFYQAARRKFDGDPAFAERARRRVVALQGGDPGTLALWRELVAESERHLLHVYRLLGVLLTPADSCGESFYNPMLPDVASELERRGLGVVSNGALVAFPPGFTGRDGQPVPLIVRKSDGGYTYATTDLAAIRHRARDLRADDVLYVVGSPQRLHFEMIFAVARLAGWLPPGARAVHVSFGQILGPDGKLLRTRSGESIPLLDLANEAIQRASVAVEERSQLPPEDRERVARAVGVGAIKYADLSGDRNKDYVFDWDRMLAMEGNTSVYLQYANARVRSVLRRAGQAPPPGSPVVLHDPVERALALKLAQLPTAVEAATAHLQPHRLCIYLYETAVAFSNFYEKCSMLAAETEALRISRLTLAELTSKVLVLGLDLLGIDAPERL